VLRWLTSFVMGLVMSADALMTKDSCFTILQSIYW
jgi:hypothetical protein